MIRSTDELVTHEFPIVRKGYDPAEVRAYLMRLAAELDGATTVAADDGTGAAALDDARAELERLRARCGELEAQLEGRPGGLVDPHQPQGAALDAAAPAAAGRDEAWSGAGDAVSRILATAHAEASGLIVAAEAVATEIRAELRAEADATQADAERDAAARRSAADALHAEAAAVLAAAEQTRAQAHTEAATIRAAAAAAGRAELEAALVGARAELERLVAARDDSAARLRELRRLLGEAIDAGA